jgi:prefoldin subunit 5
MSTMREQIEEQGKTIEFLKDQLRKLKEERQEMQEELRHYRAAVAAVKWLWDQANQQPGFQL